LRVAGPVPRNGFTTSAKAVFRALFVQGPATRPQLCAELGLSRPTMSTSIIDLDRVGYVEKIGEVQGPLGRKASVYRLGRAAGHVIAVDAGSTHVRLRVSTLDRRRLLHNRIFRLSSNQRVLGDEISKTVAEEVAAARGLTEPSWGPLGAIGIALPRVVIQDGSPHPQDRLFSIFAPPVDVPLVLENNVNCAAIAEQSHGVARGRADFAYIQVGVKVGMGIVLRGQLLRGRNGAAGEISHIAFPFAPDRLPQDPVALEDYLGADALMQRVRANWPCAEGAPPQDAPQLLTLAEAGHRAAVAAVARHGLDIGAMVATSVSIIDPGLVVLGGGIGNSAQILPHVRSVVERLTFPPEIVSSVLGPDATVLGIEQLAAEHACQRMIGDPAGP